MTLEFDVVSQFLDFLLYLVKWDTEEFLLSVHGIQLVLFESLVQRRFKSRSIL